MTILVRQAQLHDLSQLASLFNEYRVFYRQDPDITIASAFIQQRLQQQDSTILVAELQGNLCGFVQLYPIFSSVQAQKSMLLNDLFVDHDSRRIGAGRALMNAAKAYADEHQACWIMLQTQRANSQAQALYESLGYQRDNDCYYYYL